MKDPLRLSAFSKHLKSRDRSLRTIQEYCADLEAFASWFADSQGQPVKPRTVSSLDIREWKEFMGRQGWKPATVNRRLAALRSYFSWARVKGHCSANPTEGIRDKRRGPQPAKALRRPEVRKLRRAAQDRILIADGKRPPITMTATAREARRDRAILLMLLGAGLRVSELCQLDESDIQLSERGGEVTVRRGKGDRWRSVPLNRELRHALGDWLDVRPDATEDALFVGRRRTRLGPRAVQRILERLAQQAGVDKTSVSPHILRHTFAKTLVDAGEPLTQVQVLLGHESIVTTSRYATPHKEDLAATVERLSWGDGA